MTQNMTQDITTLNQRFAIENQISFNKLADDFTVIQIENAFCSASIALQGAHLLAWTPNHTDPVIWMSPDAQFAAGKSIRGGIPLCWPWFGAHSTDASFPAHGFARTSIWQLMQTSILEESTSISLRLSTDAGNPFWPYASHCDVNFKLGRKLDISITTSNHDQQSILLGQALHTYFAVGDIRNTVVHGLHQRPYLDKPDDFKRKLQDGPITFHSEVDRVYLDTIDSCLIKDPQRQDNIRIDKRGSTSTIVWNPWEARAQAMGDMGQRHDYRGMLCVESANAADDVISIPPAASHTLSVCYSVE